MRVVRVQTGALETNCWIVADHSAGPVVVIDPGDDSALIEAAIGESAVAAIVLTHGHFDHLGAVKDLISRYGVPLAVHESDADFVTTPEGTGGALFGFEGYVAPEPDRRLSEGDTIEVGTLVLRVLHTPGHTPGGICLLACDLEGGPAHLFSGDTLFAGSVGRTDFPRGDSAALVRSIAEKLASLPADTLVHPGHGPDTTIGREARINPFWPRA